MSDCYIVRRGGSGGIGLKVNAVADATSLPSTANTGDIYIVTQITLTGTNYFQSYEPTGTFAVGDVWIETSENSSAKVNAASKGSIMIGLKRAYVWGGTEWLLAELYVWVGDGWSEGEYYLIVGGTVNEEFTAKNATVTQNSGYVNATASSGAGGYYRTTLAIDLTDYQTIYCTTCNHGDLSATLGVWTATSTAVAPDASTAMSGTVATITLDVSALSGNYHVGVYGAKQSSSSYAKFNIDVYDLWLE